MRLLLVLLAVLGLLASPAAAAATGAACRHHGPTAMMDMPMPDMAGASRAGAAKPDPCCDPGRQPAPAKHDVKSCLQACALMCGVAMAPPSMASPLPPTAADAVPAPARIASLKHRDPGRIERPPRSIA